MSHRPPAAGEDCIPAPLQVAFFVFVGFWYLVPLAADLVLEGGSVGVVEGQRALHDHGRIMRQLDEAEYERLRDSEFRAFSGHWMFFYALGTASFYSVIRRRAR